MWLRNFQRSGSRAAVAGFDDVEQPTLLPMPVALVVYDIEQIGRRSAELLFRQDRGRARQTTRSDGWDATYRERFPVAAVLIVDLGVRKRSDLRRRGRGRTCQLDVREPMCEVLRRRVQPPVKVIKLVVEPGTATFRPAVAATFAQPTSSGTRPAAVPARWASP